jgi:hypothetical protein
VEKQNEITLIEININKGYSNNSLNILPNKANQASNIGEKNLNVIIIKYS